MPTLTEITLYPVKSLRGIAVGEAELTPLGLAHDRRFMITRDSGRFQTQREIGRFALIGTALKENGVLLTSPEGDECLLPFDGPAGRAMETSAWGSDCEVTDLGDEVAAWITRAADSRHGLRIVRMAEGFSRQQKWPEILGKETTVFADAAPYLVANQSSLERLNRELRDRGEQAVPMDRFRPNLVVEGLPPFAEHGVGALDGPGYRLDLHAPCERCVVTTIDQATGERHPDRQPFRTLVDLNPMPDNPKAPAFAQYASLSPRGDQRRLRVGDSLDVDMGAGQVA